MAARHAARHHGRAVQVDPTKATVKAPGTKRLKLNHDKLLSRLAFNFNLRRYTMAERFGMEGLKAGAYTRPLFSST